MAKVRPAHLSLKRRQGRQTAMILNRFKMLAGFALATLAPVAALAQSSDQCYQNAAEMCGSMGLGECFSYAENWDYLAVACHGDIQRQIEMDREFEEQANVASQDPGAAQSGGYVTGMAWGGKMRDGPGMNYRQVGSMTEGEGIEIVGDTGEWYNDFQWYEVIAHGRQAFVWGGNFCHDGGGHMEGSGGACN